MGIDTGFYDVLLVLHFVTVIVGFGGIALAPVYGLQARDMGGREGAAVARALYNVNTRFAEPFIYAVPVVGILLVIWSDDVFKFSQAWISLSFLLYFAAIGIVHGVHLPNIRRMNALMAELSAGPPPGAGAGGPPPQVAELEARGKRAGMLAGVLNLMWVAVVVLMVTKPGFP